jgi:hypothetical protein
MITGANLIIVVLSHKNNRIEGTSQTGGIVEENEDRFC